MVCVRVGIARKKLWSCDHTTTARGHDMGMSPKIMELFFKQTGVESRDVEFYMSIGIEQLQ